MKRLRRMKQMMEVWRNFETKRQTKQSKGKTCAFCLPSLLPSFLVSLSLSVDQNDGRLRCNTMGTAGKETWRHNQWIKGKER